MSGGKMRPAVKPPTSSYVASQRARAVKHTAPQPQVLSRGPEAGAASSRSGANVCKQCPCVCGFLSSECWLTGCALPCCASFFTDCLLVCCGFVPGMPVPCYLGLDTLQMSIHQQLALWNLQHPDPGAGCPCYMACYGCCYGCCGWLGYCLDTYAFMDGGVQSVTDLGLGRADGRTTYHRRQRAFGSTFAMAGKLTMADTPRVNGLLRDGAMDRGDFLGVHQLHPAALPRFDDHSKSFPLSLPSGACPMNDGSHATFHASFAKHLWNEAARERMRADHPVVVRAKSEMHQAFQAEAAKAADGKGGEPWMVDRFCVRMVHWGLFGLDLGDEASEPFQAAMWASRPLPAVTQYLKLTGPCVGALSAGEIQTRMALLYDMYMTSPALAGYAPLEDTDGCSELCVRDFNGRPPRPVSKEEFVRQLVPAIVIAGLQGPKTLGVTLVKSRLGRMDVGPFTSAEERALPLVPPPDFAFPYGDDAKLRLVILEALRLNPAVFETVFKLPSARTIVDYAGYGPKVFPKGCPVLLSYVNTGVSPEVFGPSARRWDPYGHATQLEGPEASFNGFNGVGAEGMRTCPGRELSMLMMIHMLNGIGGQIE
mmetsp:Transcript_28935/g.93435  ORF Transcript_28935/g.93435 Transcript_28935/m.93435 type:complete len:596 (+) Transcript_28935:46-1833(+)